MLSRYMCVQNFFKLRAAVQELSTTLDFDRECFWNEWSNRQAENGVMIYDFFMFGENKLVNFGPLTKKWPWPLTYDLEIQWGSRGCRCTCLYKMSSTWVQRFVSYRANKLFAISRNGEKSDNPVLWPWPLTLKLPGFVRLSRYMFVQNFVELSAAVNELSCVQRKKTRPKTLQSVAVRSRKRQNQNLEMWRPNTHTHLTKYHNNILRRCLTLT